MSRFRGLLPGLLLIVVLPLTLVLIVVAIAATTLHQNEMRTMVALHNQQAAHEAAIGLDDRVSHQLAALRSIAEATAIGLSPSDELRSSDHLLPDFDGGVLVRDARGTELAALPQPVASKLHEALKSTAAQTPGMQLTDTGDILAVVESTDRTITVTGLFSPQALRLPTLANTLRSSPRARVTVVDAASRSVYDSASLPEGSDAAQVPGAAAALRGENGATFVTDQNSLEWVVAYEPLSSVGWGLIVAEPWEDVVNPLLRTSLLTPLALIPAFIIAVGAIVFFARRVIRPLQQLDEQAQRAGHGDYDALAQPIDGISEVQTLHATLAQMADEIRRYQRSIQSYAAAITRGQEDERSRIARELHDETVQALIALDQRTQMVERIYKRDPQTAAVKLGELRDMTAGTLAEVRRMIRNLRPIYLEDLGLVPAIEMLIQSLNEADELSATLTVTGEVRRLAPERELALYRIVQEALNNVVKHAQAKQAQVKLNYGNQLMVFIHDDGRGFELPDRVDALSDLGHFGLIGMRERAELIGARLTIHSSSGAGTTIELQLPW
jgi:signal transduction histidine kinase